MRRFVRTFAKQTSRKQRGNKKKSFQNVTQKNTTTPQEVTQTPVSPALEQANSSSTSVKSSTPSTPNTTSTSTSTSTSTAISSSSSSSSSGSGSGSTNPPSSNNTLLIVAATAAVGFGIYQYTQSSTTVKPVPKSVPSKLLTSKKPILEVTDEDVRSPAERITAQVHDLEEKLEEEVMHALEEIKEEVREVITHVTIKQPLVLDEEPPIWDALSLYNLSQSPDHQSRQTKRRNQIFTHYEISDPLIVAELTRVQQQKNLVLVAQLNEQLKALEADTTQQILAGLPGLEERVRNEEHLRLEETLADLADELVAKQRLAMEKARQHAEYIAEQKFTEEAELLLVEAKEAALKLKLEKVGNLEHDFGAKEEERADILAKLRTTSRGAGHCIREQEQYYQLSDQMRKLSRAVLALDIVLAQASLTGSSLQLKDLPEWKELRKCAEKEFDLNNMLEVLDQSDPVALSPTPSLSQLANRFSHVEQAVRIAAYTYSSSSNSSISNSDSEVVPVPSFSSRLLGRMFGSLTLGVSGTSAWVDPADQSDLAKISRARFYMDQQQLGECVEELTSLSPGPRYLTLVEIIH